MVPEMPYSALRHLSSSLLGGNSERIIVVLDNQFTCHWDESGTDPGTGGKSKSDMPIILVGGYFAHVRDWISFEAKWNEILSEYQLPFFHMAEFANGQMPYAAWSDDKRDKLISSLLDTIADFPRMRLSWTIEVDDYREVVKADNIGREDIVRAYHMCARKCIELFSDLARNANHKPRILHIFDKGNAAWKSFEATFTQPMLDSLNILNPVAQSKIDVVALQSADILAHQSARKILVDSGRANQPKCLYTKRLFGKPGLSFLANKREVRRWYAEELYLEGFRRRGLYPPRVTRRDVDLNPEILADLFAPPESHRITAAVRKGQ
jgi:hypothetical protein